MAISSRSRNQNDRTAEYRWMHGRSEATLPKDCGGARHWEHHGGRWLPLLASYNSVFRFI